MALQAGARGSLLLAHPEVEEAGADAHGEDLGGTCSGPLATLINRLREGRYVIPDFQREFEWESKDIRELMRLIFLDYHIGSLLLSFQ